MTLQSINDIGSGLYRRLLNLADDFIANPNPTDVDLKAEFQKIIADEMAKYIILTLGMQGLRQALPDL